jgi:hypothetical protein
MQVVEIEPNWIDGWLSASFGDSPWSSSEILILQAIFQLPDTDVDWPRVTGSS